VIVGGMAGARMIEVKIAAEYLMYWEPSLIATGQKNMGT
jgi:hypothetical protein